MSQKELNNAPEKPGILNAQQYNKHLEIIHNLEINFNFSGTLKSYSSGKTAGFIKSFYIVCWPKIHLLAMRKRFQDDNDDDEEGDLLPDMTAR